MDISRGTGALRRELSGDLLRHARRHEGRDVAAHRGDLADQRRGDVARMRRGGEEDGPDLRRHRAVHAGHLYLVFEIGGVAEAADEDRGARLPRRVDDQPVEGDGRDAVPAPSRRSAFAMSPIIAIRSSSEKSGVFDGWVPMATTTSSAMASAPGEDVDMAVGHGIEGAGVEGDAGHVRAVFSTGRGFLARSRLVHKADRAARRGRADARLASGSPPTDSR